jgi:glycerophosphoryl diester phosphodiesterase
MRRALLALVLAACTPTGETSSADASGSAALAPANLPAFFDCLRENSQTIVAAHRGGSGPGYAENTIAAFDHTLLQAPAFLEVDVSRTRDGALVLTHDEERVRDLTLAQVQALTLEDADGAAVAAHPPTLREALDWAAGRTVLELDVKRSVSYEDAAREVREAGAMDRVIFITYSVDGASRLARVAPEAMIATTIEDVSDLDRLAQRGVDLSHIIAWTGIEEPNSALNVALAQRGVEASFGTLGDWDRRFAREGDQYAAFAETGLQVISADRYAEAVRALDANDGAEGYGALQCVGAPRSMQ